MLKTLTGQTIRVKGCSDNDADPVASNDTPQGRAQNRRVVMDVVENK